MERKHQNKTKWRFTPLQIIEGLEGILIIIACYFSLFLKPLRDRWGLTKEEADREFPGDDIVAKPQSSFTHGIVINAPAEYVWPWIAQMGKDRGGFYSYEALENLMGLGIYNVDTIIEQYQHPKQGDIIPFGPDNGCPVAIIKEGAAMVITNSEDMDIHKTYNPAEGHPRNFLHLSWLWYVEPLEGHKSRFISRNRLNFSPTFKNRMMYSILAEPVVFAMDRKMCLGIKRRAERNFRHAESKPDLLVE